MVVRWDRMGLDVLSDVAAATLPLLRLLLLQVFNPSTYLNSMSSINQSKLTYL